jgi:sucrose-phosphate synthase
VNSLLLTDIDGTLLGDDEAMWRLLELLRENRGTMGFGVASGRYIDMVVEVLEQHNIAEYMDIIISSVGTEVYYGPDRRPDRGWASHLRWKWRPERIHEALDDLPYLSLQQDQKTQREFKISYDMDCNTNHEQALHEVREKLTRAGVAHSLIFSHGSFLDILPHRASKGKAVRFISGKWNIPITNIATAGDSGNDRDMLIGQTAGIVVGNYDPELEDLHAASERVYFAQAHCAGGIIEGLEHYGLLKTVEAVS